MQRGAAGSEDDPAAQVWSARQRCERSEGLAVAGPAQGVRSDPVRPPKRRPPVGHRARGLRCHRRRDRARSHQRPRREPGSRPCSSAGSPRLRVRRGDRLVAPAGEPLRPADGRRRASRSFLSALSSSNLALPVHDRDRFDLVPAALFLHVYLAFPSGRLERRFERAARRHRATPSRSGCSSSDGARRLRARQPARGLDAPAAAYTLLRSPAGHDQRALPRRRSASSPGGGSAGRPLRRPLALLVDSFVALARDDRRPVPVRRVRDARGDRRSRRSGA